MPTYSIQVSLLSGNLAEQQERLTKVSAVTQERAQGRDLPATGLGTVKIPGVTQWENPFAQDLRQYFIGSPPEGWSMETRAQHPPQCALFPPQPLAYEPVNLIYRTQVAIPDEGDLDQAEKRLEGDWLEWLNRVRHYLQHNQRHMEAARLRLYIAEGYTETPSPHDMTAI